jgi:56kDa selenium binding protein (SBP56)
MVEISRDGTRVYFTNSLYGAVDPQFYPEGIDGWMVKLDVNPGGGIAFNRKFFVESPKSHRPIRSGLRAAAPRRIPIAIRNQGRHIQLRLTSTGAS